jgi:HD-GYP domain-containing protein (c-di-GMP phosphodiesterase class II)
MTQDGTPIDWQSARIELQNFRRVLRAFDELANVLATADEAKSWLAGAEVDAKRYETELARLEDERLKAVALKDAAEAAYTATQMALQGAENDTKAKLAAMTADLLAAQERQKTRLDALDQEFADKKDQLTAAHAGRMAELSREITAKEERLAEVNAGLEAVRARL